MSGENHDHDSFSDWRDADQRDQSEQHERSGEVEHTADALVVHGLLRDMSRDDDAVQERRITQLLSQIEQHEEIRGTSQAKSHSNRRRTDQAGHRLGRRYLALACGVGLAACLLVVFFFTGPSTLSAAEALERIIQSAIQSVDRAYEIHVLEEYRQRRKPENLTEQQWRAESNENVDGAMLYVGDTNRHVFVRTMTDGRVKKSGCDGTESWAFREDGPIHVSEDLTRFRGKVPGQQQSIAFTDFYSQLTSLRDDYDVELSEPTDRRNPNARLVGHYKSREVRGPKSIEIHFDRNDGMIHRMVLDGLPRGHGGPKKVELVLVSLESLDDRFYSHAFHDDGERKIKHEEAQP
ncbi:MAG: hypothetical protein ABGW78_14765 [Pirellulales bacterium]